ncbi:hypothetical protein TorRG33x02_063490 [Trema orientale]|uniref:Uncharacterized protein n=1 Tax=Trema orientale TaxID=63057 RepID=A0A2P5FIZ6_TREOI|nr:hypothetical protein TorRG33x02_063490 [Trema orientale]
MARDDSTKLDGNNQALWAAVTTLESKVDALSLKFDQLLTTLSPSSSQPIQNPPPTTTTTTTTITAQPTTTQPTTIPLPALFHYAPPKFHYHSTFHPAIPTPDPPPKPPKRHHTLPPQPTYIGSDDEDHTTTAHPFFGSNSEDEIEQ